MSSRRKLYQAIRLATVGYDNAVYVSESMNWLPPPNKLSQMKTLGPFLLLIVFAVAIIAQSKEQPSQHLGSIEGNNTYVNHALGLRLVLPSEWGKWHALTEASIQGAAPNLFLKASD